MNPGLGSTETYREIIFLTQKVNSLFCLIFQITQDSRSNSKCPRIGTLKVVQTTTSPFGSRSTMEAHTAQSQTIPVIQTTALCATVCSSMALIQTINGVLCFSPCHGRPLVLKTPAPFTLGSGFRRMGKTTSEGLLQAVGKALQSMTSAYGQTEVHLIKQRHSLPISQANLLNKMALQMVG